MAKGEEGIKGSFLEEAALGDKLLLGKYYDYYNSLFQFLYNNIICVLGWITGKNIC